jgi:hypothetical protein
MIQKLLTNEAQPQHLTVDAAAGTAGRNLQSTWDDPMPSVPLRPVQRPGRGSTDLSYRKQTNGW